MAGNIGKQQILRLYKTMLRESEKFTNYNFKYYAVRRVRDAFRENKTLTDKQKIQNQLSYAEDNLKIIKRQTTIGEMFRTEKLVIENQR